MSGVSAIGLSVSGQRETVMGQAGLKLSVLSNLLVGWFVFGTLVVATHGDETSTSKPDAVVVGITGHYRVGRWTSVRVDPSVLVDSLPSSDSIPSDSIESSVWIETTDGDGVRVRYEQDVSAKHHFRAYAIPGSEAAPFSRSRERESRRRFIDPFSVVRFTGSRCVDGAVGDALDCRDR